MRDAVYVKVLRSIRTITLSRAYERISGTVSIDVRSRGQYLINRFEGQGGHLQGGNVTRQGRCPDGAKVLHEWGCFPNAQTDRSGGLPRSL